uniref:Transcription termination factor 2 n=1 Tax=Panagrolaimus superbus TaxID=310955 RepID=A0A914ZD24_9BILA
MGKKKPRTVYKTFEIPNTFFGLRNNEESSLSGNAKNSTVSGNLNKDGRSRESLNLFTNVENKNYSKKTIDKSTEVLTQTDEVIRELNRSITSMPEGVETQEPEGLAFNLYLHQKYGMTWMKWRENQASAPGGILADEMGLGKTLSIISLILSQKNDRGVNSKLTVDLKKEISKDDNLTRSYCTLIVVPASLIYQWREEIEKYVNSGQLEVDLFYDIPREEDREKLAKNDIIITTYGTISREFKQCSDHKSDAVIVDGKQADERTSVLAQIKWERIILDEAHTIKNKENQTSIACCRLHALKRWAVTGTPVHNVMEDFYSLVKFLRVAPFSDDTYWTKNMSDLTSRDVINRINALVKFILLRRTKDQICPITQKPLVDLMPRNFEIIEIQLEGVELACYQNMKKRAKTNQSKRKKWVLLLRLRQACNHMVLTKQTAESAAADNGEFEKDHDGSDTEDIQNSVGNISLTDDGNINKDVYDPNYVSAKLKVLLEKVNCVIKNGDKCVIVSQWTSMLDVVGLNLKKEKIEYTTITGNIKVADRPKNANLFNNENENAKVMLLSLGAGGAGLNLVGGNHLFLLDLHWNPALERQAFDRIHRIGQKKPVFIYKLICKDTVEEQVKKLQEKKEKMAALVLTENPDMDETEVDEILNSC